MDGHRVFVLSGGDIYRINTESGEKTLVATVTDSDSAAEFFFYREALYLIDGSNLFTVDDNGISEPHGYVPLVGKDWSDNQVGEPYEARNLITPRARISYIISDPPSTVLKTGASVASIEAVYINDALIDASNYAISSSPSIISVRNLSAGDRVTVHLTYTAEADAAESLKKNTRAAVFGGVNSTRPFLWGGENSAMMYCTGYVSEESLKSARIGHPDSDALYFPAGNEFTVGDGRYPITGVGRHYDRLLIFTEGGAWMAESETCGTEEFPVMKINSTVLTHSHGATAMLGNDPITVGADSVYRWSADTDELDECNAHSISRPIDPLIRDTFLKNGGIFSDVIHNELLLYSPDCYGVVWVYSVSEGCWSRFDGIYADGFIRFENGVGFYHGQDVFLFDDALTSDEGSKEIIAYFWGNPTDFGTSAKKRLTALEISSSGGELTAQMSLDGEATPSVTADMDTAPTEAAVRRRLTSKRFNSLRVKITAPSQQKQRIHSLCIMIR